MKILLSSILLLFLLPTILYPKFTRVDLRQFPVDELTLRESEAKWSCWGDDTADLMRIEPLAISSDRLLVAHCDTLFMLNAQKQVVWKWQASGPITAQPIVDSQGTVCVIGLDLTWAGLDVETGTLKWWAGGNGRATYTQLKLYRDDTYLLVVNMGGYEWEYMSCLEHRANDKNVRCRRTDKDRLYWCRGKEILKEIDFPAAAELQVWGDRVIAVSREVGELRIIEIDLNN